MQIRFDAVGEDEPGPRWAACQQQTWPAFVAWFLAQGDAARPHYLEGRRAMTEHMPELVPLWHELVDLAGGGDQAARALSLWRPSPYLTGCSQAVWQRNEPFLVRNYDYHPKAFDGTALRTRWQGTAVLGMLDCLWGLLDGVNEHGLVVALAFAGRRAVGTGFGIPLLLRYVLQRCTDVPSAVETLRRLPTHMSYHVTLLDAHGRHGRVTVFPDRPAIWSEANVATNHGESIEWAEHAQATRSVERLRTLQVALQDHDEDGQRFVKRFLRPPLFQVQYSRGYGTLYTAVYRPRERRLELVWPDATWSLPLHDFPAGHRAVRYPERSRA
jgi:predicted choloylglycine hydrolase